MIEFDGDVWLTLGLLTPHKSAEMHGSAGQSQGPGKQGMVSCAAATALHTLCMLLHDHKAPFASLCRNQGTPDTHLHNMLVLRTSPTLHT